jgi:hypothetical protein
MPQCQTGKRPELGPPEQIQIYLNTMKRYTLLVKKMWSGVPIFVKRKCTKNKVFAKQILANKYMFRKNNHELS